MTELKILMMPIFLKLNLFTFSNLPKNEDLRRIIDIRKFGKLKKSWIRRTI